MYNKSNLTLSLSLSLSLSHLHYTAITVSDSHVIVDHHPLQMFDQTPLKITTPAGLYRCINQTLHNRTIQPQISNLKVFKYQKKGNNSMKLSIQSKHFLSFFHFVLISEMLQFALTPFPKVCIPINKKIRL